MLRHCIIIASPSFSFLFFANFSAYNLHHHHRFSLIKYSIIGRIATTFHVAEPQQALNNFILIDPFNTTQFFKSKSFLTVSEAFVILESWNTPSSRLLERNSYIFLSPERFLGNWTLRESTNTSSSAFKYSVSFLLLTRCKTTHFTMHQQAFAQWIFQWTYKNVVGNGISHTYLYYCSI